MVTGRRGRGGLETWHPKKICQALLAAMGVMRKWVLLFMQERHSLSTGTEPTPYVQTDK